MHAVRLLALLLIGAAACVLVLRCYAAFDAASLSDRYTSAGSPGVTGAIKASGIADGIRDAGILLAFAGVLLALAGRRPPGDDDLAFPDAPSSRRPSY